jgi:hypothetical protein
VRRRRDSELRPRFRGGRGQQFLDEAFHEF